MILWKKETNLSITHRICAYIKNKKEIAFSLTYIKNKKEIAFSLTFVSRLGIWTQNFEDRWLAVKSPAKHLIFSFWLTIDSNFLKLFHIEIVSLWI